MSEIQNKINKLIENREIARMGGGEKAIEKQHEKGKFTARERIQMLLDEGRGAIPRRRRSIAVSATPISWSPPSFP